MLNRKILKIHLLPFFLIIISCTLNNSENQNYSRGQNETLEKIAASDEPLPVYAKFECIPSYQLPEVGLVTRIIDGDSIKAEIEGKEVEIRYIGINTPEYYSPERKAAEEATTENSALVAGKKIFLFIDHKNTDKFGRLLRYVFTDNYFVNYEMIKRGFAESRAYPPDTACQNLFNQAAQ